MKKTLIRAFVLSLMLMGSKAAAMDGEERQRGRISQKDLSTVLAAIPEDELIRLVRAGKQGVGDRASSLAFSLQKKHFQPRKIFVYYCISSETLVAGTL